MQKQIHRAKPADNVIRVNFRGSEGQHPMMDRLSRSEDDADMNIAYHWENKNYAKAASFADKRPEIKNIIFIEGIIYLHLLLGRIRRTMDYGMQDRLKLLGEVYRDLAELHITKGNMKTAERYRKRSKEIVTRASGKV